MYTQVYMKANKRYKIKQDILYYLIKRFFLQGNLQYNLHKKISRKTGRNHNT